MAGVFVCICLKIRNMLARGAVSILCTFLSASHVLCKTNYVKRNIFLQLLFSPIFSTVL